MAIPFVGQHPVHYHANGSAPPFEDATISALAANGTTADLVIDSDSRTESAVPIKPKSGGLNLLRYYTI